MGLPLSKPLQDILVVWLKKIPWESCWVPRELAPLGIQLETQGSWLPWEPNWEPRGIFWAILKAILGYFKTLSKSIE